MLQTDRIKLVLLEEFASAQARNPNYSMRAFAKKIGISQAAISQILADKRPVTKKCAEKILRGLDKTPAELSEILHPESDSNLSFKAIDMDTYHTIADWYYFAILSLAETRDFQSSTRWIAERLGISEKRAAEAISRLQRLDLINRDPKSKKLVPTGMQFEAVSAIANPALKKACRQNIELAQSALETTEFVERDFTAITLCFDPDKMDVAKKMIKNFRRNFCKVMEKSPKKEVYKLSVQLFPLTKKRGQK